MAKRGRKVGVWRVRGWMYKADGTLVNAAGARVGTAKVGRMTI